MSNVHSIEKYRKACLQVPLNNSLDYDVENYANVLNKSVSEFNSYSVVEKADLYSTLAEFNIGLVKYLHELNKKNAAENAGLSLDWNYFPVREVFPNSEIYALGARFTKGGGMEYITCDKEVSASSIKVRQLIQDNL